jgi:hypothetical protein
MKWAALRKARRGGVQFGDDLFVYSSDSKWGEVRSKVVTRTPRKEKPGELRRDHLHLVVQKGRPFQNEHPDVPILLDMGAVSRRRHRPEESPGDRPPCKPMLSRRASFGGRRTG